jgi:hypothetical protein
MTRETSTHEDIVDEGSGGLDVGARARVKRREIEREAEKFQVANFHRDAFVRAFEDA